MLVGTNIGSGTGSRRSGVSWDADNGVIISRGPGWKKVERGEDNNMIKNKLHRYSWLILLLFALPGSAGAWHKSKHYYLSLGTSLAVGTQPDLAGVNQITNDGYPDQLFNMLKRFKRRLHHVNLGCRGETTDTMVNGNPGDNPECTYESGSQLNEAVRFLREHGRKVKLVTIDMGVNDLLFSGCISETSINVECLETAIGVTIGNLYGILATLRSAAHPHTKIIGMNYYNTFLVSWLDPRTGPEFAMQSALLASGFNSALENAYAAFEIPTADVARAFLSDRFDIEVPFPPFGNVPINVVLICQLTYMCVPPPVGPNIHANPDGYRVIAFAFLLELFARRGS